MLITIRALVQCGFETSTNYSLIRCLEIRDCSMSKTKKLLSKISPWQINIGGWVLRGATGLVKPWSFYHTTSTLHTSWLVSILLCSYVPTSHHMWISDNTPHKKTSWAKAPTSLPIYRRVNKNNAKCSQSLNTSLPIHMRANEILSNYLDLHLKEVCG
jgi:hypothetical protein